MSTFNEAKYQQLESEYISQLQSKANKGLLLETVAAMASALHTALASNCVEEQMPHAASLDLLMRAVKHSIIEPNNAQYIVKKLEQGSVWLKSELTPNIPSMDTEAV